MAIQTRGKAVHAANLGLYLDRPNLLVPERGLCDGSMNFRITNAQLTNHNVGWSSFNDLNLDGKPVLLIEEFEPTGGTRKLILGNTTDLFQYSSSTLTYITPIYATGTVTVTAADETVTLVGGDFTAAGIKAGDFIFFGAADEDDPAATGNGGWYEVASVTDATHLELTTDGPTVAGVAYTIRKTFTSSMFEPYLTETFRNAVNVVGTDSDRWYATNGADPIVGWDGITAQVYYSHSGVNTCKALRRFKNTLHLIAPTIGGALNPGRVVTSAIGEPENISTLEATSIIIGDGDVPLIAAQRIGELLAYYSEREIILAQFVGAPIMFVFRQAVVGYGARSARGIVRFPTHHTLFATDGQYNFDGVAATQSSSHVWKEVTRRSSPNRPELVQGIIDEGNAELLWVVPLNSDADADDGPPEHAYVGHYLEDSGEFPMPHSFRDLPATAVGTYLRLRRVLDSLGRSADSGGVPAGAFRHGRRRHLPAQFADAGRHCTSQLRAIQPTPARRFSVQWHRHASLPERRFPADIDGRDDDQPAPVRFAELGGRQAGGRIHHPARRLAALRAVPLLGPIRRG
jgi:hypothetical protein